MFAVDAIQRWGATAVVTLITDEEIDYLKIPDLQQAVRDRHMEWWHLPIQDGTEIRRSRRPDQSEP